MGTTACRAMPDLRENIPFLTRQHGKPVWLELLNKTRWKKNGGEEGSMGDINTNDGVIVLDEDRE